MDKTLHITNGDNFTSNLNQLHFEGKTKTITWREMLCEGQTISVVGSEAFWRTRYHFLSKTYKMTRNRFVEGTLKEYRNLCNQKTQDEIVLWFNQDLAGQINMIAVLSWLKNHKKNVQISIVSASVGDEAHDVLSNLGKEALQKCYENRIYLKQDDIEYADYIWQLYCSDNPIRLATFSKTNTTQLQQMPEIIKAHIRRFPTVKNGLNHIENAVLLAASKGKIESENTLVKQLFQSEKIYGFTELQYKKIIERLTSLFHTFTPIKLNPTGNALLKNGTKNYYAFMRSDDVYLGGSKKYSFLYHKPFDKLLKL